MGSAPFFLFLSPPSLGLTFRGSASSTKPGSSPLPHPAWMDLPRSPLTHPPSLPPCTRSGLFLPCTASPRLPSMRAFARSPQPPRFLIYIHRGGRGRWAAGAAKGRLVKGQRRARRGGGESESTHARGFEGVCLVLPRGARRAGARLSGTGGEPVTLYLPRA